MKVQLNRRWHRAIAVFATVMSACIAANAHAKGQVNETTFDLPAGTACPGFDLRITRLDSSLRVDRTFKDKNGNVVRRLTAGIGAKLTFTNLSTSKTLSISTGGSVEHVTINQDGSETWTVTGHNVLVLFPTDIPAGPSTTLYLGRLVYRVDTLTGVFTLQDASGQSLDICAAVGT